MTKYKNDVIKFDFWLIKRWFIVMVNDIVINGHEREPMHSNKIYWRNHLWSSKWSPLILSKQLKLVTQVSPSICSLVDLRDGDDCKKNITPIMKITKNLRTTSKMKTAAKRKTIPNVKMTPKVKTTPKFRP